jgi:hypothetical protein
MRAIGLVLLSIAIMALLLTDADAKRRSSAQGSQAAGASGSWCAVHPRHGGENVVRSMLGDNRGGRRLVPPQSISGHATRDYRVRSKTDARTMDWVVYGDEYRWSCS